MEEESIHNQQNISGGQGLQVDNPQAPTIQAKDSTIMINYGVEQQPKPTVLGTPHNLPYSGAIAFVGREDELAKLHATLQQENSVSISAIAGMGGIGKTELALQYAIKHRNLGTYSGGVCWLRARKEVGTQIVTFARSNLDLKLPKNLELEGQVQFCWQHWQTGDVLIVLDDVQAYEDVEPFLPPADPRF